MNRMTESRIASASAVFVLTCALIMTLPVAAQESIQRNFDVSPGGRLVVEAERGSIEVVSGDTNQVRIEILPRRGTVADLEDDYEIAFHQMGDEVEVTIEAKSRLRSWFSWNNRGFTLKAMVPRRFDADLKTSGGSIAIDDLLGDVRSRTSGGSLKFGRIEGPLWARTSGGSLKFGRIEGPLWARTSGGSIRLEHGVGDADVKTSGGSIHIGEVEGQIDAHTSGGSISIGRALGRVEATTSGGSITARFADQPQGDCELSTSGGNVTVHLSPNLRFDLDAKASGGVRTDVPIQVRGTVGKRELRGPINGGGPQLRLRTSGGRIRIKDSR